MLTLHGTYVPSYGRGFFFVWAPLAAAGPARWGAAVPAAPPQDLLPALRGVPYITALECRVLLPTPRGFVAGRQQGCALSPAAAAQWLARLPPEGWEGIAPGPSLQVWAQAARLLLDLVAAGHLRPAVEYEAGVYRAAWRVLPPEGEAGALLGTLALAMPDVCRAVVPPEHDPRRYQPPPAPALIESFWQEAVAGLAQAAAWELAAAQAREWPAGAVAGWLLGLAGAGPEDLLPGPEVQALVQAVAQWAGPGAGALGPDALRCGLRLLTPADTPHGRWEVEVVLQTDTDPPATVPAAEVWQAAGRTLTVAGRRYHGAEQRIRSDLPSMARLWPPLEVLCHQTQPARLRLDTGAVANLLLEGAPRLTEAGHPVLLPANLVRGASVQARAHLRPAESQLGLDQLVQVNWDLALGGVPLTLDELRRLAQEKLPLVQVRGRWVQVDPQSLAAALKRLEAPPEGVGLGAALRLAAQAQEVTAEGWVAAALERLREPARVEPVPVPAGFCGTLRPYQRRGLDWLAFMRRHGLGACLADDMGLGKTVQVIALLLHEREQGLAQGPTLLVCPVSLVGNWRRELARFAPGLRVLVHHGAGRAGDRAFREAALAHDVVITTYSLLARDEEDLAAVPWAGVVADEAQNIKNPAAQQSQALRRIARGYRIALTGTPVENHLGDLWALFAFLNPGYLGCEEEFRRTYALPAERGDAEALARLRRLVQPFILRRLKTDPAVIQDLPEKVEAVVYATLTPEQAALYEAVVQDTLAQVAAAQGIRRHGAVLAGLTKLKQVCNHPACLLGDRGPLAGRSGKVDRLLAMLQEVVAEGDRALVFTQFPSFGRRLRDYLAHELGCPVLFLDGATPQREREAIIARFQAGEAPVFLLSVKAGGTGLNLTAANHVFHLDRWWNPAAEDQATDRAFRIGQERRVLVHKLVTAGTLEERIDRIIAQKRALAGQVVTAGEAWLGQLSTEELRELIALERE